MTITVYGHSASTFTSAIFHTLKELGLPYEYKQKNSEDIKSPEYIATKHPFGRVPFLDDDGFQIYESRAIARYLVNKYQGTKTSTVLIPSDVHKAALVEQFISVETSYYTHPLIKMLSQLILAKNIYEKLLEGKDYLTGEFSLADLLHIPYTFYAINIAGESELWINALTFLGGGRILVNVNVGKILSLNIN
ncbi:thioredoxin-like protein [Rhizophagus irregularis]|uniref:glutathione transferase n=2 Tax=Rhizophagus irregularis TaxID=588596 RepID=A0A2N0RW12_9GLOM|nr:thioredoxin-like protein [Rhizophagus irregularis]